MIEKDFFSSQWYFDDDVADALYKYFIGIGKEDFVTEDILSYLGEHPEVAALNSRFASFFALISAMLHLRVFDHKFVRQAGGEENTFTGMEKFGNCKFSFV